MSQSLRRPGRGRSDECRVAHQRQSTVCPARYAYRQIQKPRGICLRRDGVHVPAGSQPSHLHDFSPQHVLLSGRRQAQSGIGLNRRSDHRREQLLAQLRCSGVPGQISTREQRRIRLARQIRRRRGGRRGGPASAGAEARSRSVRSPASRRSTRHRASNAAEPARGEAARGAASRSSPPEPAPPQMSWAAQRSNPNSGRRVRDGRALELAASARWATARAAATRRTSRGDSRTLGRARLDTAPTPWNESGAPLVDPRFRGRSPRLRARTRTHFDARKEALGNDLRRTPLQAAPSRGASRCRRCLAGGAMLTAIAPPTAPSAPSIAALATRRVHRCSRGARAGGTRPVGAWLCTRTRPPR